MQAALASATPAETAVLPVAQVVQVDPAEPPAMPAQTGETDAALLHPPATRRTPRLAPAVDPLAGIKEKAAQELFVRIGSRLNDTTLTEEQLHLLARAELAEIVAAEQLALTTAERNRLIDDIGADVLGYGPLEAAARRPDRE